MGMEEQLRELEKRVLFLERLDHPKRYVVNVKDYGAKGDGTTDDTDAIEAAVAAVHEGGTILIPTGIYKITNAISITKRVSIIGNGTDSVIYISGAINGLYFDGSGIAAGLQGCILRDLSIEGRAGTLNAIYMDNCYRNRIENITIPSIGSAGLYLYGSLLNTILNLTVSVNLPSLVGSPVNPTYGVRLVNDGLMTSNSNVFINLIVEGITTNPGIGVAIPDAAVSNIFIGGTSEGNDVGVQLGDTTGAGTTNNVFLAFHVESNTADWDIKYASGQPDYNVVLGQYQQPPGITNWNYLFRQTIDDGTSTDPAIRFFSDQDTGIYLAGTSFAIAHSGAIQLAIGADYNISYNTFLPGANDSIDIGDVGAGLRWRNIDLTGIAKANRIMVAVVTAAPADTANGMIVYADGTTWDPGSGAGFYGREAGAWVKL